MLSFLETIDISSGNVRYRGTTLITESDTVAVVPRINIEVPQGRKAGWAFQTYFINNQYFDDKWHSIWFESRVIKFDSILSGYFISFYPFWYGDPFSVDIFVWS